jgi:hypothetical protein
VTFLLPKLPRAFENKIVVLPILCDVKCCLSDVRKDWRVCDNKMLGKILDSKQMNEVRVEETQLCREGRPIFESSNIIISALNH